MATTSSDVAAALGLGKRMGGAELAGKLEKGLPVSALERVSRLISPLEPNFKYLIVRKATLARRKSKHSRLTTEESDRVARLARLWELALDVWGDAQDAHEFLFKPHAMLDGKSPVDATLQTSFGAREAEAILGRAKYGSAA